MKVLDKFRKPLLRKLLYLKFFLDIFKVYCADHTYTTLKLTMDSACSKIITLAAEKLGINNNSGLVLCEVRSSGGNFDCPIILLMFISN